MKRNRSHAAKEHGIDLAPMLGFVLTLLILFIHTGGVVKELGLRLYRPDLSGCHWGDGGQPSIPIAITASGEIYVDNRLVDLRAVQANVERVHAENPDSGLLVVADRNAKTGVLTQVVDRVRLAGIHDITFSTN